MYCKCFILHHLNGILVKSTPLFCSFDKLGWYWQIFIFFPFQVRPWQKKARIETWGKGWVKKAILLTTATVKKERNIHQSGSLTDPKKKLRTTRWSKRGQYAISFYGQHTTQKNATNLKSVSHAKVLDFKGIFKFWLLEQQE